MADELLVWAAPIGAWLVTYVIHSAILIALAYLILRKLESKRPELGDVAWKLALVGALITASLKVGTGISPLGNALSPTTAEVAESSTGPLLEASWAMATAAEPAAEPAAAPIIINRRAPRAPAPIPASTPELAELSGEPPRIAGANLAPVRTEIITVERAPAWLAAAVAAWLAGALLFGGALMLSWIKLRWLLRRRQPIKGRPAELLDRVAWRAGLRQPIRLSVVDGLDVPIAFGVLEPEIALPARAEQLGADQLETLLAHECAHLVRRDPGWRLLAAAVRSVFWIQPLNRLVCRRLESCSELCADDWAVAHTDRPLELARCLTEVARWLTPRGLGSTVPAMARPGSVLGTRVRRLVETPERRAPSRWFGVAAIAVVVSVAFAAPGASSAAAAADSVLPTAAFATPEHAEQAEQPAVERADHDTELAAAAVRELVAHTTSEVQIDELLEKLNSGELDATLNQWLKGPGFDWEDWEIEFDFDFEIEVDDDGADPEPIEPIEPIEPLDPRDFIDDFNHRWQWKGHDRGDNDCDDRADRDRARAARQAERVARRAMRARELAERHRRRAIERAERARRRAMERVDRHRGRDVHRRVFRKALEAQREALREAVKARGDALENARDARENVERAMREAERALREAEQIRQRFGHPHRRDRDDDDDDDDDSDVDVDALIVPDGS